MTGWERKCLSSTDVVFHKLLYQLTEHSIQISASLSIGPLITQKLGFLVADRACINSLRGLMCSIGSNTAAGFGGLCQFCDRKSPLMILKGKRINYTEISD